MKAINVVVFGSLVVWVAQIGRGCCAMAEYELPEDIKVQLTVPPVASPKEVVSAMMELAAVGRGSVVADLGCGDGRIVLEAARRGAKAICVEMDESMIAQARSSIKAAGFMDRVEFVKEDLRTFLQERERLARINVVTVYLSEELNDAISASMQKNLVPGTKIVSHAYPIRGWKEVALRPVFVSETKNTSRVYLYIVGRR